MGFNLENRQAIIAFSQSEKVKAGLIWCSQLAQLAQNLPQPEQSGALRALQSLIAMLGSEIHLALQTSRDGVWLEADKHLNNARVMIDSGVPQESVYHLTQTLSQVNRIGQKAMSELVDKGLL